MKLKTLCIYLSLALFSCNSFIQTIYDDTTAKYNAYFIANETIKEIEDDLQENLIINYDSLIELSYIIDTNQVSNIKEKNSKSIEKLSILIQTHPESKYVYPSYALIGKSRLLNLDLRQAITTLKYVNSKSNSQEAKYMSLVYLMRTYTENHDYNAAVEVYKFLKNKPLNNSLKIEYYKNAYHLFKTLNVQDNILNSLFELEKISKKRTLTNKIYFAIGQIYLKEENYEAAKNYFLKCIKNNPNFEMEFYAKIYYAKSSNTLKENEILAYFKKLLRDKKNVNYLDKIYFELGNYYLFNNNYDKALENFSISIKKNQRNKALLFRSYLESAEIYYDKINNYELSKLYYDSAITNINREHKRYKEIKEKSNILSELVKNLDIIRQNDSLIHLTTLSENELLKIINEQIKKNQKKSKKRSSTQNNRNIIIDESKIILSSDEIGVWYFNNPTVISRGRNEFISKWGERELEDNWRLLSKISFSEQEEQEEQETTDNVLSEIAVEESDVDIFSAMKSLPFDEGEKILLNKETEKAFYELGKLYIQNLEEKIKGIDIYEKFIPRFHNSELLPDVYYQLYLVSENKDYYKNIIINEYSESIYSKLIINPNYEIDDFKEYNTLLEIYGKLYNQLISENNNKVINAVDSLAKLYGENEFFEKISLLKAIAIGKKGGNFSLQFELKNFLNFANEKSTIEYASALLNSAEKVHEEFVYSGLPLFNSNKDERFFFVIVNETEKTIDYLPKLENILIELKKEFIKDQFKLNEKTSLDIITHKDLTVLKTLESRLNRSISNEDLKLNTNFVVGEKNLNLIFKSKNYTEFEKFYNR